MQRSSQTWKFYTILTKGDTFVKKIKENNIGLLGAMLWEVKCTGETNVSNYR